VRNLTRTLAVVSLLAPAGAHPLGIGGIKLHSALNQNLNAEIPLVLSAGEKAEDVKVSLAPPDKFDEAGVPWSAFLAKIKFERSGNVIRLSSREALKEPFLDFLLEVSWPKGTVYRQFTVLVDPPATYRKATIPVTTPVESYAPEPEYAPQREPVSRPKARPQRSAVNASEYGPTRPNDTLWKVAKRTNRYGDVSAEQMMIALYKANPGAFYKENVNALMAGKTLKIPAKEAIVQLSRKQAITEFNRQAEAWKNRELSVPTETAPEVAVAKESTVDKQLILAAPTEATVADKAVIAPGTEQTATEAKAAPEKPAADAEKATPAPDTAGEEGAAQPAADAATQNRLAALETQLAEMQKMLALKDEQLSALQGQSQTMPAVESSAPAVQPRTTDKVEATRPVIQPEAQLQPKPVEKPAVQPEPASDNTYYLGVGGAGVGILALLGWFWWRKRKAEEETDTESMFASSMLNIKKAEDNYATSNVDVHTGYGVEAVGESSFLSEFTPSDFDAFDTSQSEIDPISEADVYLAYGRYQQAEELIRQAIKDQPDRDECKLKLLEIFYANENKAGFETYAQELAQAGKKDQLDFWSKVAEMGSELCPDSALFSSGEHGHVSEDESADIFSAAGQSGDKDEGTRDEMTFAAFGADLNEDFDKEVSDQQSKEMEFDLSSFEVEDDLRDADEQRNNDAIDFDLSSFESDSTESEDIVRADAEETQDDFESFNFDLPSTKQKDSKLSDELDLSEIENADEGFETIDFKDDSSFDLSANADSLSLDTDFDFNFDFNTNGAGKTASESEESAESGFSDLTDMDELETKLDLAKAYIDMGDTESAQSIAEEVLANGSAEQKKMAEAILDELK